MFKRTRREERDGVRGLVTSELVFLYDGHVFPLGVRVEKFEPLPDRVGHMAAGIKAFGRAFVHNRKFKNGREYLEVRPDEWIDVTTFDSPFTKESWADSYIKELSELKTTEEK